jgi:hypothetical protein
MKSFITALILLFAFSLGTNVLAQDKDKKGTTTTNTTTTVTKDGKTTTKKITKKISKTAKKECVTKSGCCEDESNGSCSDSKKDTK